MLKNAGWCVGALMLCMVLFVLGRAALLGQSPVAYYPPGDPKVDVIMTGTFHMQSPAREQWRIADVGIAQYARSEQLELTMIAVPIVGHVFTWTDSVDEYYPPEGDSGMGMGSARGLVVDDLASGLTPNLKRMYKQVGTRRLRRSADREIAAGLAEMDDIRLERRVDSDARLDDDAGFATFATYPPIQDYAAEFFAPFPVRQTATV